MMMTSGASQSNCWTISMPHRLLALDAEGIHGIGQVKRFVLGDFLDQLHAAVKIRVQVEHERAVGDGLDELGDGDFAARQEDDRLDARRRAIGRQRRRSVAGRGADHRLDGRAYGDHLLDLRDEHGHAEILERPAVGVAAQFDPQIVHTHDLPETLGPEKVGAAFIERDDVVVFDLGQDPLLLAPDAGAVGPLVALVAVLEKLHPRLGIAAASAARSCCTSSSEPQRVQ